MEGNVREHMNSQPNVVCNERNQQIASSEFSQTHVGALFLGEYYTVFGALCARVQCLLDSRGTAHQSIEAIL